MTSLNPVGGGPGGVFSNSNNPIPFFNHTVINRDFDFFHPPGDKYCLDLIGRKIPSGLNYVPGPDQCTLCICEDGGPKFCKAVLCAPPSNCKSFRVGGHHCCDFICLDDSLIKDGDLDLMDMQDLVPKLLISAVTAMLTLSLLFFLINRLRKRHMQGRINSAEARRDDSPDYSLDFYDQGIPNNRNFLPRIPREYQNFFGPSSQYFAWLKPPDSYFSPGGAGEAPPPYEEAIASSSTLPAAPAQASEVNQPNTEGQHATSTLILTNENINNSSANSPAKSATGNGDASTQSSQSFSEPVAGPSSQINLHASSQSITGQNNLRLCGGGISQDPGFIVSAPRGIPPPSYSVKDKCSRRSLTLPKRMGNYSDETLELFEQPPPPPSLPLNQNLQDPANIQHMNRQRMSLQLDLNWKDNDGSSSSSSSSSSTISISSTTTHTPTTPQVRRPALSSSSSSSSTNN